MSAQDSLRMCHTDRSSPRVVSACRASHVSNCVWHVLASRAGDGSVRVAPAARSWTHAYTVVSRRCSERGLYRRSAPESRLVLRPEGWRVLERATAGRSDVALLSVSAVTQRAGGTAALARHRRPHPTCGSSCQRARCGLADKAMSTGRRSSQFRLSRVKPRSACAHDDGAQHGHRR